MFFELALLLVLVVLVVLAITGGQRAARAPLVLSRAGLYHFTLSPRLERIQSFLHCIVSAATDVARDAVNAPTLFFDVRDGDVAERYLLAVALRQHTLYIQAISHVAATSAFARGAAIRDFSDAVMVHHPYIPSSAAEQVSNKMNAAVQAAANEMGKCVQHLPVPVESRN